MSCGILPAMKTADDKKKLAVLGAPSNLGQIPTPEKTMNRNIVALLLITATLAIAACNTVRGAGDDLGSAANSVENEMDDH